MEWNKNDPPIPRRPVPVKPSLDYGGLVMTDKQMPDVIYAWKPDILYGEFTASSRPKDAPAVKYIRENTSVIPEDVLYFMKNSILSILAACGNSYSNKGTENMLSIAKKYGCYDGKTIGNIHDLIDEHTV